jgi:hypothetical protein
MSFVNNYVTKIWGADIKAHNLFKEGEEEYEKFTRRIRGNGFHGDPGLPGAGVPFVDITPMTGGGEHVFITISWQSPGEETSHSYIQESFISN